MIFAKVDVTLAYHPKAHEAGAAMATWQWALLYSREQELDGFIPRASMRLAWVGEKQGLLDAARLVLVGLFAVAEGGWRLLRYEAKNETKETIGVRRGEARERMLRVRANKPRTPSEQPPSVQRTVVLSSVSVPGSDSDSDSGSDLGSEIASGEVLARTAPLDEQARMVFATIAMNRQVGQTVEVCWTSFAGHYAGQYFPNRDAVLGRWQKWVNQQAVYAEKGREQDRRREDEAAERKRFAKEGPAKPPPPTKAQEQAFAEELASRVRASRAARAAGGGQ